MFLTGLFYKISVSISDITSRVIVASTNKKADQINDLATNLLPGTATECLSLDSLVEDSRQAQYPTEFLNSLNISGLPPHKLILKIGAPIIMIRNLNPNAGLCNGTRLIVKNIYSRLIEAEISIGKFFLLIFYFKPLFNKCQLLFNFK